MTGTFTYDQNENVAMVAAQRGLLIARCSTDVLQLDIDSREQYEEHWKALNWLWGNELLPNASLEVAALRAKHRPTFVADSPAGGQPILQGVGFFPTPWNYHLNFSKHHLVTKSQSKGVHVYLRLRDHVSSDRQLFLQSLLGSDPWRERLNFKRFMTSGDPGNVLFETPDQMVLVNAWLANLDIRGLVFGVPFCFVGMEDSMGGPVPVDIPGQSHCHLVCIKQGVLHINYALNNPGKNSSYFANGHYALNNPGKNSSYFANGHSAEIFPIWEPPFSELTLKLIRQTIGQEKL